MFVLALLACSPEVPSSPSPPTFLASARKAVPQRFTGVAAEVLDVPGYTYVRVVSPEAETWIVGLERPVQVGDPLDVTPIGSLTDFESRALQRSFDRLVFALFKRSTT